MPISNDSSSSNGQSSEETITVKHFNETVDALSRMRLIVILIWVAIGFAQGFCVGKLF